MSRMSKFIRPLVEVPLHVRRRQLYSSFVKEQDQLHQEGRSGHLLGLLVQKCKNVPRVVGDKAKPSSQQRFASF